MGGGYTGGTLPLTGVLFCLSVWKFLRTCCHTVSVSVRRQTGSGSLCRMCIGYAMAGGVLSPTPVGSPTVELLPSSCWFIPSSSITHRNWKWIAHPNLAEDSHFPAPVIYPYIYLYLFIYTFTSILIVLRERTKWLRCTTGWDDHNSDASSIMTFNVSILDAREASTIQTRPVFGITPGLGKHPDWD